MKTAALLLILAFSQTKTTAVGNEWDREVTPREKREIISAKSRIDRASEKSDFTELKKVLSRDYFVEAKGLPTFHFWAKPPQDDPNIQRRNYKSTFVDFAKFEGGVMTRVKLRQTYSESTALGGRSYLGEFRVKEYWIKKNGRWKLHWTKYETQPLFKLVQRS